MTISSKKTSGVRTPQNQISKFFFCKRMRDNIAYIGDYMRVYVKRTIRNSSGKLVPHYTNSCVITFRID